MSKKGNEESTNLKAALEKIKIAQKEDQRNPHKHHDLPINDRLEPKKAEESRTR